MTPLAWSAAPCVMLLSLSPLPNCDTSDRTQHGALPRTKAPIIQSSLLSWLLDSFRCLCMAQHRPSLRWRARLLRLGSRRWRRIVSWSPPRLWYSVGWCMETMLYRFDQHGNGTYFCSNTISHHYHLDIHRFILVRPSSPEPYWYHSRDLEFSSYCSWIYEQLQSFWLLLTTWHACTLHRHLNKWIVTVWVNHFLIKLEFIPEVLASGGVEVLQAAALVNTMKTIVHKIVFNHVLNFGFIEWVVLEIHHSVAHNQTLQVDVIGQVWVTVVDNDSDSNVRDVLARVALSG